MEWFDNLDPLLKAYWIIAGVTSLFFIIQTILTFIGVDGGDGADIDTDGGDIELDGPFQLFTLRNLINFLLGFGWGGICFYNTFDSKLLVNVFAFLTGLVFVAVFFLIVKQFLKLSRNNSFKISNTIGKTADVYLAIPAGKTGKGKIQISVNGAFHEIDAMTEGDKIPTGGKARVIEVIDSQTVLVSNI